ncbi:MAG: dCTP deaminase [Methylacidiphilales bacterium]|nr:dCTP deaminase [Candidatus Methylacidiphilales bacterium]
MILKAEHLANLLDPTESKSSDPFVITPAPDLPKLKSSGSASIDLRLGCWLLTLRQSKKAVFKVADASSPWSEAQFAKTHYVPFGGVFILHPQSFVLAATLEWIRMPKNLAGYVIGRSSWGRVGLIIATATGVHPGFTGCLTLELTNVGEIPIEIKPGMSICQLFVHSVQVGTSDSVDQSRFVGSRKPRLGKIVPDETAQKLIDHTI